jgi:hypothetical protein
MMPARPVDSAMAEARPQKQTMRLLWLREVQAFSTNPPNTKDPWFMTLPGSEGKDIQMLIDAGLLSLTEVQSISETDVYKVVAVEYDNNAVASLIKKYPGLRIKEADFRNLIGGEDYFNWPDSDSERFCRAHIINLDFNSQLSAILSSTGVSFPVLEWIDKLCLIHSKEPAIGWTLFLTLNANLTWRPEVCQFVINFIRENLTRDPAFREQCRDFLEGGLFDQITSARIRDFTEISLIQKQRILMILVPKIIALRVQGKCYRVQTTDNISYGGGRYAPMVSWIFKFILDKSAVGRPDATYREALRGILAGVKAIRNDGSIS